MHTSNSNTKLAQIKCCGHSEEEAVPLGVQERVTEDWMIVLDG